MKAENLENYKPRLKPGRLLLDGDRLVYEISNPVRQILLPTYLADILTLCNGNNTVREIIEKIYKKQRTVRFRQSIETILNLEKRGFFENSISQEKKRFEPSRLHSFKKLQSQDFWWDLTSFQVLERLKIKEAFPILFLLLSFSLIVLGVSSCLLFIGQPLQWDLAFRVNNSVALGFVFQAVVLSLLVSWKTLVKSTLQLLATQTVYDIRFQLTPFFFALTASSESALGMRKKSEQKLYVLAALSSIFPALLIAKYNFTAPDLLLNTVLSMLLLFLFEINPFRWSEFRFLMNSFRLTDPSNPWFLLQTRSKTTKSNQQAQMWPLQIYVLFWSGLGILSLAKLSMLAWPYLIYHFETGKVREQVASSYILCLLLVAFSWTFFVSVQFVKKQYFERVQQLALRLFSLVSKEKIPILDREETVDQLIHLPVLNWLSQEQLMELLESSRFIYLLKDQVHYEMNGVADKYMVLLSGFMEMSAPLIGQEEKWNRWDLGSVSVFGEEALTSQSTRTSRAVAKSLCTIVEIPTKELFQFIDESHYAIQLSSFRTAILVNQYFHSAPIFSDLSEDAIQLMMSKGILEEFSRGETIFEQGHPSHSFYLLIQGSVDVVIGNEHINSIPQGGFFGEIGVIADIPRTATIRAESDCIVFKIGADAFWELLLKRLEIAVFIEAVGEIRMKTDMKAIDRDIDWRDVS